MQAVGWGEVVQSLARVIAGKISRGEIARITGMEYMRWGYRFVEWCREYGLTPDSVSLSDVVLHAVDEGYIPYAVGLVLREAGRADIADEAVRAMSRAVRVKKRARELARRRFGVEPLDARVAKAVAASAEPRIAAAFSIMYSTGAPVGRVAALRWSDLTAGDRCVAVNGSRMRVVPLTAWGFRAVSQYRLVAPCDGYLFAVGDCASHMHRTTLQRRLRSAVSSAAGAPVSLLSVRAAGWARVLTLERLGWKPSAGGADG